MDIKSEMIARPFLRWAGSKRKVLPQILEVLPEKYNRYVEPFAGSACLFYSLKPKAAILGDINSELINTYLQIKTDVQSVMRKLSRMTISEEEYYRVRALDPSKLKEVQRAARFVYLNRLCFNGLYRTNKKGQFNVPYGGKKCGAMPDRKALILCSEALKNTRLISGSFEKTISYVRPGDFVYLDPPYCISSRRIFNEYALSNFNNGQLTILRKYLKRFDKVGVPFLVSYGASREAYDLAKGFKYIEFNVQRQIAGFTSKRRKSRELLITNY